MEFQVRLQCLSQHAPMFRFSSCLCGDAFSGYTLWSAIGGDDIIPVCTVGRRISSSQRKRRAFAGCEDYWS